MMQKSHGDYSLQILLKYTIMTIIVWAEIFPLLCCYWCM